MNRRFVYEDTYGNCRIVIPDPRYQQAWEKEEAAVARLADTVLADVTDFLVVRPERIPTDLTFREAWKKGDINEPVKIDLELAISIHRKRIQKAAEKKIEQMLLQLESAIKRQNTPEAVAIRATMKILQTVHQMNLTHCKKADDVKWSVPRELRDVWDFYPLKE